MPSGSVDVTLRPLKLAFVVNPSDKKDLLTAIELNSFLWGGMFNPIVPHVGKIPHAWKGRFPRAFTPSDILKGYVSAFDPDIIVTFNERDAKSLAPLNRLVIREKEILECFPDDYTVKYGIGLPEILNHFAHQELRFQRRKPITMRFPYAHGSLKLLCSSVFGRLPPSVKTDFDANFADYCGISYEKMALNSFCQQLAASNMFPRRITGLHISTASRSARFFGRCLFFFDGEAPLDIIDFWNLRALGIAVAAVPQQAATEPTMRDYSLDFIHDSFAPYRHNPGMFHHATLIPGTCCSQKLFTDFIGALQTTPKKHKHGIPELNIQPWYPRIWDNWGIKSDGFECSSFRAKTTKHSLQTLDGTISLPQVEPEFISRFGGDGKVRFANEIDFRLYGGTDFLAEIIPESDAGMERAIGGYGLRNWRFSSRGPVYLASHSNWDLSFSCPKAESVFSEWFRSRGWKVGLSTSGKIAKQMAKQLGGSWGIQLLAHDGLVELLCSLAGGKSISEVDIRKKLNIIGKKDNFGADVDRLLKSLIDAKALSLGLEFQCPTCSIRSWFSIKDVDYSVTCPNCFSPLHIPCHSPKEMKWSYRAMGPFSLPKASFGAYCVLLTLAFFARLLYGSTTPMLSFEATKENLKFEADLGMFYSRSVFTNGRPLLIFSECKTHLKFKPNDISRMAMLSRTFPGALIVFATLNSKLSTGEISRVRALVNRSRKRRLRGKPFSEVLIITANELFSTVSPTFKWESLSDKHKALTNMASRDLEHLADATQQLYLDMESWNEWFQRNRPHPTPAPAKPEIPKIQTQPPAEVSTPPKIYLRVTRRLREVRAVDLAGED